MNKKEQQFLEEVQNYFTKEFSDVEYTVETDKLLDKNGPRFQVFYIHDRNFFLDGRYEKLLQDVVLSTLHKNKIYSIQFMYKDK